MGFESLPGSLCAAGRRGRGTAAPLRCAPVLLTLSTTHRPATDLGFLLHKHPERVQTFSLPFGTAHVLYPEASEERCTAALVMDVDPVGLVRRGRSAFALAEYVNDRPYVASSLLSVALVTVFKTAMEGLRPSWRRRRSRWRPRCRRCRRGAGGARAAAVRAARLRRGRARSSRLDPAFPEWGASRYVALRLSATVRLSELLTHLYVLLPVLDDEKHYWVDDSEVEKLQRRGADWLPAHPERELIARRYLKHERRLFNPLLASFDGSVAGASRRRWRSACRCATSGSGRCKRSCRLGRAPRARSRLRAGRAARAARARRLRPGHGRRRLGAGAGAGRAAAEARSPAGGPARADRAAAEPVDVPGSSASRATTRRRWSRSSSTSIRRGWRRSRRTSSGRRGLAASS